jgi:hypothetical protein
LLIGTIAMFHSRTMLAAVVASAATATPVASGAADDALDHFAAVREGDLAQVFQQDIDE